MEKQVVKRAIELYKENGGTPTPTGKMFLRLPYKYWNRVRSLEEEWDLIDDCRFILTFKEGWTWGGYDSVPVKSVTEAIRFTKESYEVNV